MPESRLRRIALGVDSQPTRVAPGIRRRTPFNSLGAGLGGLHIRAASERQFVHTIATDAKRVDPAQKRFKLSTSRRSNGADRR